MSITPVTVYRITKITPLAVVLDHLETMKTKSAGADLHIMRGSAVFFSPATETIDQVRYRLNRDPADLMRPLLSDPAHEIHTGDIVEAIVNDPRHTIVNGDKGVVRWTKGKTATVFFGNTERAYSSDDLAKLRHFARS